jgi:hypothetical protein
MRRLVTDGGKPKKKKLMRPSFSNERGCWIIDHVFYITTNQREQWLFLVNQNTRYCFARVVKNLGQREVNDVLHQLINEMEDIGVQDVFLTQILGDGAKAYIGEMMKRVYGFNNIKTYFNSSAFTYHNKILDRCVRTIRDMLGYRLIRIPDVMAAIRQYNNTYHKAIDCTPTQMMCNPEWENQYIRYCRKKLKWILFNQRFLQNYEHGNILFVHLEFARTSKKFEKQRRFWNRIAVFLRYDHGNVCCQVIGDPILNRSIVIPIYYTKYLCAHISAIPERVRVEYGKYLAKSPAN